MIGAAVMVAWTLALTTYAYVLARSASDA